ncbi:MAG: ABC transporter substrate-binding protein [Actinomycetota bacterium]
MLLAAVMVTGCTQGTNEATTAEDGATSFRTGEPTKPLPSVDWYTFYRPVLGLVAATWADYPEYMVSANLCESLVRVQPDYSIVPGVADFTVSEDFKTYTYTIREGAAFWDGTPVTTDDVMFSLTANTTPPFGAAFFAIADAIDSVSATAERTVTITLKAPDINFNSLMTGPAGKIYQKKQAEAAGEGWGSPDVGVMCTGPYTLGSWDPASSLSIKKNPNYWSSDFSPLVDEVVFTWPQDPTTLTNAFTSGEIQGGWNIPPSIITPLQGSDKGQMYVGSRDTAVQIYGLIVGNVQEGPLADPRMRQAISALIDREAVASKVYSGAADPLYTLATPGSITYEQDAWNAANEAAATGADPERAKQLVSEAGQTGKTLTLALPAGDSLATITAKAIQTDAAKAGITMELMPMEASQYAVIFLDPASREGIDLFFTIYAPTVRDPVQNYFETIVTGQVNNFNGYSNPEVDALIGEAKVSTDPAVRAEKALAAQQIYLADLPYIPISAPRVTVWEGTGLTGAPTTFTWINSPWAALLGGN